MGRKERRDVDYFPFFIKDGRTLFILEGKYQCKGTGFFTNLFRFLSRTPDHHFQIKDEADRLYFFASAKCDQESGSDMIKLMVTTGKLDKDLWEQHQALASQDFLDSIQDAYRKRSNACITMQEIKQFYGITSAGNPADAKKQVKTDEKSGEQEPKADKNEHNLPVDEQSKNQESDETIGRNTQAGVKLPEEKQQTGGVSGITSAVGAQSKVKKTKEKQKILQRARDIRAPDPEETDSKKSFVFKKLREIVQEHPDQRYQRQIVLFVEANLTTKNPDAIVHCLSSFQNSSKTKQIINPKAWLEKALAVENGNYNEQESMQDHEKHKANININNIPGLGDVLKSMAGKP